ncbi:hypothetical protein [Clostridium botulinum]|uniref:hypothetical protein n=1 Tax=Clostridium botulinum TaxID=1491 RepID=UPI0019685769|nr:hypothetical protein [Clostridium botulinum]
MNSYLIKYKTDITLEHLKTIGKMIQNYSSLNMVLIELNKSDIKVVEQWWDIESIT